MVCDAQCDIETFNSTDFYLHLYNQDIKEIIRDINSFKPLYEYSEIKLYVLSYRKHDAILISQKDYQYKMEIGKIIIILHNDEEYFFIVEVFKPDFDPHIRSYELDKFLRYECVPAKSLYNSQKLHVHKYNSSSIVKPKYGFVTIVS